MLCRDTDTGGQVLERSNLRTLRALSLTRFQMAQLLGTDMPTWGTYEDGLVRIPPDEALKLAPHGIPLNWIYEGKMANLPPHIRAKIRQLAK